MHKKIAVLLSLVMTVLSVTGCTGSGRNYFEELEKVKEWEAYHIEIDGSFEAVFQEETYDDDYALEDEIIPEEVRMAAKVKVEGYINEADGEGHLFIDVSNEEWGEMPTMDLFFNKEMVYVNRAYLLAENHVSRFDKFKEKYIAYPLTSEMGAVASLPVASEWDEKSSQIFKNMKVDVPFEVNERAYTVALDHKELMDIVMAYGKGIYENREELLGGYVQLLNGELGTGVEEMINDAEESMENIFANEDKIHLYTSLIRGLFEGTSLEMTTSFSDQAMIGTFKGKLQYLDTVNIDADMSFSKQKAQKRPTAFPKDVKMLTLEEFEQYRNPFIASYYLYSEYDNISMGQIKQVVNQLEEYDYVECFKTDGQWYLDLETLTSYLNYTSRYDEARKKYYLVADEEMTYDKVYEQLDALAEQYELEEMSNEDYNLKEEAIWASCHEIEGAKRLYVETVQMGDYVYVTLSELHKLGFESREEVEQGEYKEYFAAYLDVYEPIK